MTVTLLDVYYITETLKLKLGINNNSFTIMTVSSGNFIVLRTKLSFRWFASPTEH